MSLFSGSSNLAIICLLSSLSQWHLHGHLELTDASVTTHVASSLASAPYSAAAAFTSAVETRSSIATATGFQSSQADAASGLTPEAVGHEATDIVTTTFSTTAFPQCHDAFGPIAPFCQPTDGSDVYVGETYYSKKATVGNLGSVLTCSSHLGSRLFSRQLYHNH